MNSAVRYWVVPVGPGTSFSDAPSHGRFRAPPVGRGVHLKKKPSPDGVRPPRDRLDPIAAADRDQASIVFTESANMVEASPVLTSRLDVVRSRKRIAYRRTRSFYQALSADVPTKEGVNAHYILFDELHAQRTRELFDTLRYAGAARRQPLFLMITTAGYDRHSICYEQYDYARKVTDGIIDDLSFLVYIAEAEESDDWHDRQVWQKSNPSLGITIDLSSFEHDHEEATQSATKENRFRAYLKNTPAA